MVKKLFATLIAIVLTISQLSCMAASADSFKDIDESSQKNAIEILHSFGLVNGDENGNFNPDKEISRVEFLAMIVRMIGQEGSAKAFAGGELPFTDIPANHWGRGYIYFAYKMGIVNGISQSEFAPNNKVTYNQAIKMAVSALGYGIAAERKGGWPSGYLAQAIELDLTDGVKQKEHNLKREETARIVLNGLSVPMLELLNDEYKESSTPLEIMGYKKYNGVVTSTFEAQTSQKELGEGEVEISGVLYDTTHFVNIEMLGSPVTFYTEYVDGEEIVRYVYKRRDAKSLDVQAADIYESTTLEEFVYNQDNKTKKVSLAGNALKIVYNGKVVGSSYYDGGKILQPESGSVSLRDSDGNNIYDIAIVNDLKTIVVSAITEKDIFDKYGNSISLDMDEEQISVYKNGSRVSLEIVENGDILAVGISKDNEKLVVYVSDEKVTGKVATSYQDGAKTVYEIETEEGIKEFTVAKQYLDAQKKNLSAAKEFSLGDTGVFYLNYSNEIAYCEITSLNTSLIYGYILDARSRSGLSSNGIFKLLTADNKILEFEAENKIDFGRMSNGKYVNSRELSSEAVNYLTKDVEFAMQLCSYQLNEDGKITELQLADTKRSENDHLTCFTETESMYYSQRLVNQKYIVDENTVVFYVPSLGEYEDVLAAGKYNKFLSQGSSLMTLYDVKNNHVGAAVLTPLTIQRYDNGAGEYETIIDAVNSPVLYIQNVSNVPGEDGSYYMNLTGIEDGEIVNIKVADVLSGSSEDRSLLKPGVAIQYEMNDLTVGRALTSDEESLLIVFKTVYDFNKDQPMMQTYNYMTSYQNRPKISVIHSRITTADPSFVAVELDGKASPTSGGTVYMSYDPETKNKFELINAAQLSVGQEVMMRLRYLNTREVVVIER